MQRLALLILLIFLIAAEQAIAGYGKNYCNVDGFHCIRVKSGQTWTSLWPDPYQRDLIKRINRINVRLSAGMKIAVPNNVNVNPNALAPFTQHIQTDGVKTIVVSPAVLAWAAYSPSGDLIKWGPISGGKDYCPDIDSSCRSRTGTYYIYEKRGPECISSKFPIDEGGGAPMPYCMFYSDGYALHGSPQVPGYHASHGCIRLFTQDARWLNQDFIGSEKTRVIVLPYNSTPDDHGF